MQNFRNLLVWKRAKELVKLIYQATHFFPQDELYGLTSQMRRSSISVVSNIVEGRGRKTDKEFFRYLTIARGSLEECAAQIELTKDLDLISDDIYNKLIKKKGEVGYLLHKLIQKISNSTK